MLYSLPNRFRAAIVGSWPDTGPLFLARLPELVREFEERWEVDALPPFPLSYNYVAPARKRDGTEVVLKFGVPNPELATEIEALRLYGGKGAAALLEADVERGALLLERVRPGEPLAMLDDDEAGTLIAADLMERLWRPLPAGHTFPDLRRWTRSLAQYAERHAAGPGPLPGALVRRAHAILNELLAAPEEPVLIHADFHHWNVLRAEREPWLAVDPKGVAAERTFEIGPLLYNPIPTVLTRANLARLTERRLDLLSERLQLDRRRALACGLVAAVLSACWSVEEGSDLTAFLAFAQILAEMDAKRGCSRV